MCELVAEIASCFTASEIGIPHGEGLENHAAYVKSWLDQMKGDSSFIFKASRMASATTDFLLAFVRGPEAVVVA
jgi:antirestriction protein ArdC